MLTPKRRRQLNSDIAQMQGSDVLQIVGNVARYIDSNAHDASICIKLKDWDLWIEYEKHLDALLVADCAVKHIGSIAKWKRKQSEQSR